MAVTMAVNVKGRKSFCDQPCGYAYSLIPVIPRRITGKKKMEKAFQGFCSFRFGQFSFAGISVEWNTFV